MQRSGSFNSDEGDTFATSHASVAPSLPGSAQPPRQPRGRGLILRVLLITFLSLSIGIVSASPVTFWFAGVIDRADNPGGTLPSGTQVGTPFFGQVTYDGDYIDYQSTSAGGAVGNYYFRKLAGFTAHVQVGPHTLTNALLSTPGWAGNISVYDNFDNADHMFIDIGQAGLIIDGQPHTNSVIELYLNDQTQTAQSSPALPITPPTAAAFGSNRQMSWAERGPNGETLFYVSGDITDVSAQPLIALNIRKAGASDVQVSWPLAVSPAQLEWATTLEAGAWQKAGEPVVDVGLEHTVTLPATTGAKYFRLTLP